MRTVALGALAGLGLLVAWALVPLALLAALVMWLLGAPRPTAPLARPTTVTTATRTVRAPLDTLNTCPDCGHVQLPPRPLCWLCGSNLYRESSVHLWI